MPSRPIPGESAQVQGTGDVRERAWNARVLSLGKAFTGGGLAPAENGQGGLVDEAVGGDAIP